MNNPFYLKWNNGWKFTLFLHGGIPIIEAKGFGVIITSKVINGESPKESADRMILKEQIKRKSIYNSWKRSLQNI